MVRSCYYTTVQKEGLVHCFSSQESIDKFASKARLLIFDEWFRGEMVHMQNDSEMIYKNNNR